MKNHFAALDGLRGLAAIAVMMMHEVGIFRPGIGPTIHGHIAVDMFFILSGFVLAYSYDDKLDAGMSWSKFMIMRLIRLYPLLLIAVILGFGVALLKLLAQEIIEPGENLYLLPAGLLLLPVGPLFGNTTAYTGTASLIPFGGPAWSLLFEFIASAVFATSIRRLGWAAAPIFIISSLLLCYFTYKSGGIGELGMQGYIGIPAGLLRVGVSFMIGIYLMRSRIYNKIPSINSVVCVLAGLLLCIMPIDKSVYFDLICVFVAFPIIIAFCAQSYCSSFINILFNFLGKISYPLYLLHFPVSRITGFAVKTIFPQSDANILLMSGAITSLVAAWVAFTVFDKPLRRRLMSRMKQINSPPVMVPPNHHPTFRQCSEVRDDMPNVQSST